MKRMTKRQYLTPNTAVRSPVPSGDVWIPPSPSQGERSFKLASKGSVRGFTVIDRVRVDFESRGEYKAQLVIRARPDTLRIVEQSPRVEYIDDHGQVRSHVFDLRVFRTDGTIVAIDVKPASKVKRSGIRGMHDLIARQIPKSVATHLLVFSERMYTRCDLYNAELIHAVARQDCPDDDHVILGLISRMKGPAPIADLVRRSKLNGYGFNAVVRAIAGGRLRMTERQRIEYGAIVAPLPTP